MTKLKMGVDLAEDAGKLQVEKFGFAGVDCTVNAPDVNVPTLIAGMKADVYAGDDKGNDMQDIFDALTVEKQLLFFGPGTDNPFGNGQRFEGYGYYNYHPEPLIEFLNTYMGGASVPPNPAPGPNVSDLPVDMQKKEDHFACQYCDAPFGLTKHAHRCRSCGKVLCRNCSPKKIDGERACVPCWSHTEIEAMNKGCEATPAVKIETSVEIDAPASVVWGMFADGGSIHTWSSSMQTIVGDFKEGGDVTVNFKFMGLDLSAQHTIRNFEEGVQWSWADEMDFGISNNHLYRIEVVDETHSRFINNDELTGGDQVIRYGIKRNYESWFDEFNEQVKTEAEKRVASP